MKQQDSSSGEHASRSNAHSLSEGNKADMAGNFVDNRPAAVAQRQLQHMADNSAQVKQMKSLQEQADHFTSQQQPVVQQMPEGDDDKDDLTDLTNGPADENKEASDGQLLAPAGGMPAAAADMVQQGQEQVEDNKDSGAANAEYEGEDEKI